jgi:hypothetical protein
LCRKLYRDSLGPQIRTVIVAGAARSGSTWLGDLIASQQPTRVMFEPFHAGVVPEYSSFPEFLYMRPEDENSPLEDYCRKIFEGRIRDPWIDRQVSCINPRLRVVKEVRINLMLRWMSLRFPDLSQVLIFRHPCSVVLSRMSMGWTADGDLKAMLTQQHVVDDFLEDRIDYVNALTTDEERHAAVWCLSYLVPIRQFGSDELPSVFYERLIADPESELASVFALARINPPDSIESIINRPSLTSKSHSAVVTGDNKLALWKNRLSTSEIRNILAVVETFGMSHLYDDGEMPLV